MAYIARRNARYEVADRTAQEYECPHCGYEWLEWNDSTDYPYHCPHCGESLYDDEEE